MTIERALEINAICVAHAMYREGISDGEPPPSLEGISLGDMLAATRLVERMRPRTQMTCDDRLLAALYVAYNYQPCELDDIDPVAARPGAAVCVVKIKEK